MKFDNEYARFQNIDEFAVGRNYVEMPSKMNKNSKSSDFNADTSSVSSDFLSNNKDPLPF